MNILQIIVPIVGMIILASIIYLAAKESRKVKKGERWDKNLKYTK